MRGSEATAAIPKIGVESLMYYVYILTNERKTVLYTGVTRDLYRRVEQHREHQVKGFTYRYNVTRCVYYEVFSSIKEALAAEKTIKAGSRAKKIELIESVNPEWNDLCEEV